MTQHLTSLLDELRWLKKVTEDDTTNVYGRTIETIESLNSEVMRLEEKSARLEEWLAETQMNAANWMRAHDKLKAGKPYDLPSPADLPNEVMRLREALGKTTDLLARYRKETPSGHSPHMICHQADVAIGEARASLQERGE